MPYLLLAAVTACLLAGCPATVNSPQPQPDRAVSIR